MSILAFKASPRQRANSSQLLNAFLDGVDEVGAQFEIIDINQLNLRNCQGCLKCNLLKRCVIRNDDWQLISQKIIQSKTIVFATPIYFHHFPAKLKTLIDRFRSFLHIQILENDLKHTPWIDWEKRFILLLALGSPLTDDAQPVIDRFHFICNTLGPENELEILIGTRLAVKNQILMNEEELRDLYGKLKIPTHLAEIDFKRNKELLDQCYALGIRVAMKSQLI